MPIHPEIARRLPLVEGIASFPEGFADRGMRERLDAFVAWPDAPPPPRVDVYDDVAPGPHGPVPVRVHRPRDADGPERPALVWLHGGAFRMGDLDMVEADGVAREVCERAGAAVVGVDYRLALGGVHHPVPLDDVVAAVRWVRDRADVLGIAANRVWVGGASAGGTLATGAALRLRDDDGWLPAGLVLAYATLHPAVPAPSPALAAVLPEIPRLLRFLPADCREITVNYLGGPISRADGYAMPGLADLQGLCPVTLLNAEYDDLRASAEAFAAQLAVAGVDVAQVLVPGMLHGFLNLPGSLGPVGDVLDRVAALLSPPAPRAAGARALPAGG